jgi:hypothetical protein
MPKVSSVSASGTRDSRMRLARPTERRRPPVNRCRRGSRRAPPSKREALIARAVSGTVTSRILSGALGARPRTIWMYS